LELAGGKRRKTNEKGPAFTPPSDTCGHPGTYRDFSDSSASSATQKSKARAYMQKITELIDGYEVQIKVENYSEEDKKALLDYLNKAQSEVTHYGQVRSMDELRTKIAFLTEKIALLERPEEWKTAALADPEERAQDDIRMRLAVMESKLDVLMDEKLTNWDVVQIFFILLAE